MNHPPPPAYAGCAAKNTTAKTDENLKKIDLDMIPLYCFAELSFIKSDP